MGVKLTLEWYMRAMVVVGMPLLLIRSPRGASGVYNDGVHLSRLKLEKNASAENKRITNTG